MQYKVLEMGNGTTKTGKPYKKLKLEGTDGNHNVNIFSDWPDYANITFGSTIDGTIEQNGQYENIRSSVQTMRGGAGSAFKTAQVKEVMDIKRQDIGKFQDNKELSIKMASTMRMAVDLAIAEKEDKTVLDTLEQGIRKWRTFCWENWDVGDKDFQPFN